jgi:cell wall-associated NlpC family hydrolase
VRYALAQLGKPYRWGGAGPDAFDCSGLTMKAWASAGVVIPRTTYTQIHAGTPEPLNLTAAHSGDLVFIPGSNGTPARPGHMGMVAGWIGDRLMIVHAPRTGDVVKLIEATRWRGQIVAVRHIA